VPDAFSVELKLDTDWTPERIREEAARYYAVPVDQVGPVRKSNGQLLEAAAA
jgi:metal-sulfur cluster biosynthetic enzyme